MVNSPVNMVTVRNSVSFFMALFSINYIRNDDRAIPIIAESFKMEYDYVIIGSGSAGSTLANRLSEDPDTSVLVLEAGGPPNVFNEMPLVASGLFKTDQDWNYFTEPQKMACLGLNQKRSYWPRGRVVGGCGSVNFNIYIRGNKWDYERWKELGANGWGWDDVFPYFLKSEDNRDGPQYAAPGYHSRGGELKVEKPSYSTNLGQTFIEAGRSLGYQVNDPNGPRQTGFHYQQGTLNNGFRSSPATAFLVPASRRPNVDILTYAFVTKIVFDEEKRARSVMFNRKNMSMIVHANKEVILSAGAINSPHLLLLSGVGPRKQLERFKIPVVADVPGVGENLQDHISPGAVDFVVNVTNVGLIESRDLTLIDEVETFFYNQTGHVTMLGGSDNSAFLQTKYADLYRDWPDLQYFFFPFSTSAFAQSARIATNFNDKIWDAYYAPYEGMESFSLPPILLRPKSRGFIRLRSRNPYTHPLIDPQYLTHQEDVEVLVEGIKLAMSIGESEPFKRYGARIFDRIMPGCENFVQFSDDYLRCWTRVNTLTVWHPAGTCKMGDPRNDPMAVVDNHLRVVGVKGLRVIDASIMPSIVSGNLNAPTIMIAEKAADLIRGIRSISDNSLRNRRLNYPITPR